MAAFLFWLGAVFLGFIIQQNLNLDDAAAEPVDPLSRFVGSAKEAFGDTLFLKADVYFHGGVLHEHHHDDSSEALEKEGVFHEEKEPAEEMPKDWIAKINHKIQVHELMHLNKDKRKEMLPFFAMATTLDPHNVEAVLTTAYWLYSEFGKPEDAANLLKKGIRDNPSSWEMENALARFFERKKEWASAEEHFRKALEKTSSGKIENFERVDMNYRLAETRLKLGKKREALEAYREASRYFDNKTTPFLQSVILRNIKELSGV